MGAANIAAGFFQGFAISTSGSRTAVAEQAGAKSQVTGLVGASVVVLLLLVFNSLLADLPQSALAAVVIAAAFSLMDVAVLRRYARVRRTALVLSRGGDARCDAVRGAPGNSFWPLCCRFCFSSAGVGGLTERCWAGSNTSMAGTL